MPKSSTPAYEAVTEGVTVRIVPRYLNDESSPSKSHYVWAYSVEIENGSDVELTLKTRHWEIVDAVGRKQIVDGEGVVGQTPTLKPGEHFRYTSGAPLSAPSGIMGGSYIFRADNGDELVARIPTFSLDSPYSLTRPN